MTVVTKGEHVYTCIGCGTPVVKATVWPEHDEPDPRESIDVYWEVDADVQHVHPEPDLRIPRA